MCNSILQLKIQFKPPGNRVISGNNNYDFVSVNFLWENVHVGKKIRRVVFSP